MEMDLRAQGLSYDEAHRKAEEVYNYQKALKEYKNGTSGKN